MSTSSRWRRTLLRALPLLAIIVVALVLRIAWLLHSHPVPVADCAQYLRLAESLLTDGSFSDPTPTAYRLPAYPALLAALLLVHHSHLWLGLVNVLLATSFVPLVYLLAINLVPDGKRAALIAASLCALNPTFVFFSPLLVSENLFVPLLLLSLLTLQGRRGSPVSRALLSGACLGLAILTRGDGLFYGAALLILSSLAARRSRDRLLAPLALTVVVAALVLPWALRNQQVIGPGAGLSTSSGVNFYYAHNAHRYGWHPIAESDLAGLGELERHRTGNALGWEHIKASGARDLTSGILTGTRALFFTGGHYSIFWATRAPKDPASGRFPGRDVGGESRLRGTISPFYVGLLPLVALSLLFLRRWERVPWLGLAGFVIMNWVCYAIVFWGKARYRFVSELVFCVLAGACLYELIRWGSRRVGRQRA